MAALDANTDRKLSKIQIAFYCLLRGQQHLLETFIVGSLIVQSLLLPRISMLIASEVQDSSSIKHLIVSVQAVVTAATIFSVTTPMVLAWFLAKPGVEMQDLTHLSHGDAVVLLLATILFYA